MKKLIIIFFSIILFLALVIYRNNHPGIIISGLEKSGDIKKSGKLIYRIYLLGILPIGEAVFSPEEVEVYQGQAVYHLNATARSLNLYSQFFKGYAAIDSYIDIEQLSPLAFRERLKLPDKGESDKELIYDQEKGIMYRKGESRQIPPNTQDPLSAIFNIRRMDFDKTKEFEMNINTNQKNYILRGEALLKGSRVKNKIYRLACLKLKIGRRDENPYHKSNITIQLLREKENTPILIKVFAHGILINARLIGIN